MIKTLDIESDKESKVTCYVSTSSGRNGNFNLLIKVFVSDFFGGKKVGENKVNRLHQDSSPVDGVEGEEMMLGGKLLVGQHVLDGKVQIVGRALHFRI